MNSKPKRLLHADSPAMTRFAPVVTTRPSPSQKALLSKLQAEGRVFLEDTHAATLAGLVRRGLARFDDTHAYPVEPS